MCGRYVMDVTAVGEELAGMLESLRKRYRDTSLLGQMGEGEVFPSQVLPVILPGRGEDRMALLRWGLPWPGGGRMIINARSEMAADKPVFRRILHNRCLVPATGYYEWRRVGREREKHLFTDPNSPVLYMAGIYDGGTEGGFVILTRQAQTHLAFIHDRMPVTLTREQGERYLAGGGIPGQGPLLRAEPVAGDTEGVQIRFDLGEE